MMNYEELDLHSLWKLMMDDDDNAYNEVLRRFNPLIVSELKMDGLFNEDVFQDIRAELLMAIKKELSNNTEANVND